MYEFEKNDEIPEEEKAIMRAFLERVPEAQSVDPTRYQQILYARYALEMLLEKDGMSAEIELDFDPVFSSAHLSVEIPSLLVSDMELFVQVFCFASTLSFLPLTNGNIQFSLSFSNAMLPI